MELTDIMWVEEKELEKGLQAKEWRYNPETEKGKGMDLPPGSSVGNQLCKLLAQSPVKLILNAWCPELKIMPLYCVEPLHMIIYYRAIGNH